MQTTPPFLDLPQSAPDQADVLLLPLPWESSVSYGRGTSGAPEAIWRASLQVEFWDEELDWQLDSLRFHSAPPLMPTGLDSAETYLERVCRGARELHQYGGTVVGVGGEHSVTPALVAASSSDSADFSTITVVQIDAHADLRDQYEGTKFSHACAMRRIVEKGGRVLAIGIRSADREEFRYGQDSGHVQTFFAQQLAEDPKRVAALRKALCELRGNCYLTIDVDGLDCALCPATGTPQPGGLGWWQTLGYLRSLLLENRHVRLCGMDVVETVPQSGSQVNEFTAARLLAKAIGYYFCRPRDR